MANRPFTPTKPYLEWREKNEDTVSLIQRVWRNGADSSQEDKDALSRWVEKCVMRGYHSVPFSGNQRFHRYTPQEEEENMAIGDRWACRYPGCSRDGFTAKHGRNVHESRMHKGWEPPDDSDDNHPNGVVQIPQSETVAIEPISRPYQLLASFSCEVSLELLQSMPGHQKMIRPIEGGFEVYVERS